MEVGCYSLDLYCRFTGDRPKGSSADARGHMYNEFPHTFTGEPRGECARQARNRGWTFQRDGEVTCPRCNAAKISKP